MGIFWRESLCTDGWKNVDQTDGCVCLPFTYDGVLYCIFYQFYRYLLPCLKSYSIHYFFFKTKMYGLFQTAFYFGYMALFSLSLGLMCATMGYVGTSIFVRKIYSTVKID